MAIRRVLSVGRPICGPKIGRTHAVHQPSCGSESIICFSCGMVHPGFGICQARSVTPVLWSQRWLLCAEWSGRLCEGAMC
jgi:hypothetical protein